MEWWYWVALGLLLLSVEIFAIEAQFYLVFMGLSAIAVGLLGAVGLDLAPGAQWAAFAVFSLVSMFSLRKTLHTKIHGNSPGYREGVAGEFLTLDTAIEAGEVGRVSYRGSKWTVVNEGANAIDRGARVQINRSEGLTLYVGTDA
ncbi:MAG: NfeD family protein [Pseudomonadota bacterium]